jgi:hypothetical protein
LDGLYKALEEVSESSKETSQKEPFNKKVKYSETTVSEASTSTAKSSEGLSPLDYVLEKQSTDPIDPTDDLE